MYLLKSQVLEVRYKVVKMLRFGHHWQQLLFSVSPRICNSGNTGNVFAA